MDRPEVWRSLSATPPARSAFCTLASIVLALPSAAETLLPLAVTPRSSTSVSGLPVTLPRPVTVIPLGWLVPVGPAATAEPPVPAAPFPDVVAAEATDPPLCQVPRRYATMNARATMMAVAVRRGVSVIVMAVGRLPKASGSVRMQMRRLRGHPGGGVHGGVAPAGRLR